MVLGRLNELPRIGAGLGEAAPPVYSIDWPWSVGRKQGPAPDEADRERLEGRLYGVFRKMRALIVWEMEACQGKKAPWILPSFRFSGFSRKNPEKATLSGIQSGAATVQTARPTG